MAAEPRLIFGQLPEEAPAEFKPGNLSIKFLQPPFSVLDSRKEDWQGRRRDWLSLGIKSELGRGLQPGGNHRTDYGAYQAGGRVADARAYSHDLMKGDDVEGAGISVFDPVLCELAYRWWAPEGGPILDPFAGGSVRGIVAATLGHPYTGVDLSLPQIEANRHQAAQILTPGQPVPTWLHGDSRQLDDVLPAGQMYDLVFTCPPYFDLEVYSDDPADLSRASTYASFLEGYREVIARAAARLRPERFLVVVVSEIRDKMGFYRGLVPDTVAAGQAAGLHLYNEAILVNSIGSAAMRATKQMEASRKLARTHQNVLCFIKGNPPRGWSYDRAAPPSPQLDLSLLPDPAPAPVLVEGTIDWVADVEGLPDPGDEPGDLTDVELHTRVWLKRDDLYEQAGVRGGKVRTCWQLAQGATGLVTAGSRSSPQANIVAHVAAALGIPCRVHTPEGALSPELVAAQAVGAEVVQHKAGYNSVIIARAREDAAARGWREIPFGMECQEAVEATAGQVANVPAEVGRIVVPVGSGMSLAGILHGLERAGRTEVQVLGVVVGADPAKRLDRWAPAGWRERVELVPSGSDYHQPASITTAWGLELDAHYEAKAAPWCEPGDLLWLVGIRATQALPGPSQPAPAPAAVAAPTPAPVGATPDDARQGPSVAVTAQDQPQLVEIEGGRLADPATGELFDAPGVPVPPLEPVPDVPALTTHEWGAIQPSAAWRCAGCGTAPSYPLQATLLPDMARGECENCGTEKVYTRADQPKAQGPKRPVVTVYGPVFDKVQEHAAWAVGKYPMKFTPIRGESEADVHLRGFAAEAAVCQLVGLQWVARREPDPYDLEYHGHKIEVKHSRQPHGPLWIHAGHEGRDVVFVLTTGTAPRITVVGWCTAAEAMTDAHWRADAPARAAWAVPQAELHPIAELIEGPR